jgi:hypothetical protein
LWGRLYPASFVVLIAFLIAPLDGLSAWGHRVDRAISVVCGASGVPRLAGSHALHAGGDMTGGVPGVRVHLPDSRGGREEGVDASTDLVIIVLLVLGNGVLAMAELAIAATRLIVNVEGAFDALYGLFQMTGARDEILALVSRQSARAWPNCAPPGCSMRLTRLSRVGRAGS